MKTSGEYCKQNGAEVYNVDAPVKGAVRFKRLDDFLAALPGQTSS